MTTYYMRAYATNSAGTGYGDDIVFSTTAPAPGIDDFTPHSGRQGTNVIIIGSHFTGATAVRFAGTDAQGFQIDSDNWISALVGEGSSGHIMVISPRGTATSAAEFTYLPDPIPALNEWGLIALSVLLACLGYLAVRERSWSSS